MDDNFKSQLPRYRSHKTVWALKIERIDEPPAGTSIEVHGVLVPEDKQYAPFPLTGEYMKKHNPQAGGYYVRYEDGYESWSPAAAFESGYSIIKTLPKEP